MPVGKSTPRSNRRPGRVLRLASRLFNPLVLRLAGTRLLPLYGVIEHRGRRSGRAYLTPVVVAPTADGFIVPMPWGQGTDWYRNVRAAGACVVRWKGRDYPLVQPQEVETRILTTEFGTFERTMMRRLGISLAMRLRHSR